MEIGPEEMAQCLSVFTEDWSLIFIIHGGWLTTAFNSSSRGSDAIFQPLYLYLCDHTHTHTLQREKEGYGYNLAIECMPMTQEDLGLGKREGEAGCIYLVRSCTKCSREQR